MEFSLNLSSSGDILLTEQQGKAEVYGGRILVPYHSEVLIYDGFRLVRFMMFDPVHLPEYGGSYHVPIIEAGYADPEGFKWVKENPDEAMDLAMGCEAVKKQPDMLVRTISLRPLNTSLRDHLKNPFVHPKETQGILGILENYARHEDDWKRAWSRLESEGIAEARGKWVICTPINGSLLVGKDGLRKITGDRDFSVVLGLQFIVSGVEPPTGFPDEEEKKEAMHILARKKPDLAMLLG
jgi:hypothetical protein